jgi:hypothetical protein
MTIAAYTLTSGTGVIRVSDGAQIPGDPANADWQIFQVWLAAGNTPNPAPAPTAAQQALLNNASAGTNGVSLTPD